MSYSDVIGHHSFIFDGVRNSAYLRALKRVVTPESIVMDLGAGLGIHGLLAAKLGAKEVHLVEPTNVIEVAKQIASDNGLDNVHFHQCRAEELKLSTKVDVLISVFTGNFLLEEDLLPSLFYARDRFLRATGTLVPERAIMEVLPVSMPDYFHLHLDRWSAFPEHAKEHGMPPLVFDSVRKYSVNSLFYGQRSSFNAVPLAKGQNLMELDLSAAQVARCDSEVVAEIQESDVCHGWLGWFKMKLGDEWLTTSGEETSTHWSVVFLPLDEPITLDKGDRLQLSVQRPEFGDWTWVVEYKGERQRQSTFLSQVSPLSHVRKLSENYSPRLDQKGTAAVWVMGKMDGAASVGDLAEGVRGAFPESFATHRDALKFVRALSERFS
ncbi:MAG: methyltransferase domain-containing protein [Cyanobacteria bacterium P01_F01_bin.53]